MNENVKEAALFPVRSNVGLGWNRCDVCGKYIALNDFEIGVAVRHMTTPDSAYSTEDYETLCKEHTDA